MRVLTILIAAAVLILCILPRTGFAQQTDELALEPVSAEEQSGVIANLEEFPTVDSMLLENTTAKDLPWAEGADVIALSKGQTVHVFSTHVNEAWVAIVIDGVGLGYVPESAVALTAPPYEYGYLEDVTRLTAFTGEQLDKALAGTGLAGLGYYYAEKEATHGINALFLIAIAKLESAGGTSSLARRQNNLGGIKNGSGGYLSFGSKEECIEYMATLLRDSYLTEGARYYSGKTSKGVSVCYCEQSESWWQQVETLMQRSYNQVMAA